MWCIIYEYSPGGSVVKKIDFLNIRIRVKWTLRGDAHGKNKLIRVFIYFSKCIIDGLMADIVMPPSDPRRRH